jgi:hypothetical protein
VKNSTERFPSLTVSPTESPPGQSHLRKTSQLIFQPIPNTANLRPLVEGSKQGLQNQLAWQGLLTAPVASLRGIFLLRKGISYALNRNVRPAYASPKIVTRVCRNIDKRRRPMNFTESLNPATVVEQESDLSVDWTAIEQKFFANQGLHSGKRILRLEKGLYVIRER